MNLPDHFLKKGRITNGALIDHTVRPFRLYGMQERQGEEGPCHRLTSMEMSMQRQEKQNC